MQVVILAGGLGTRISEQTYDKPKPMIPIGGMPILWHIMKIYSHYGFNDFIICIGYKGHVIKEFFHHYSMYAHNLTVDLANKKTTYIDHAPPPWTVTIVETGPETQTGGRLKRIEPYLKGDEFLMTYGDGLADVNVGELVSFHRAHGKMATVTAVNPLGRFGALNLSGDQVVRFHEKPSGDSMNYKAWVSGGYFVFHRRMLDYISGDSTVLEQHVLGRISDKGQLMARKHPGFWHPVDTPRDLAYMETLWRSGEAPWKIWEPA